MNTWPPVSLGEYCNSLTGFPFKSAQFISDPSQIKLLRGDNIAQQKLRWENAKYWPVSESDVYEKYRLVEGDIVLAMDRPWIEAGLKISLVRDFDLPALLVQRVSRLRGTEKLNTRYLYYTLTDQNFTNYVKNVQTGTGVPHISPKQISSYQIPLPPIEIQRKIADILGSLDDKIELNHRMNESLEQMAMALYKHWFVDFGPFQDMEFEESEIGFIPSGWDVKKLEDLVQILTTSVNPGQNEDSLFLHYSLPAFDMNKLPVVEKGSEIKSNKYLISEDSILISKLNPETYRAWTVYSDTTTQLQICSTEFIVYVPKEKMNWSFLNTYLRGEQFVTEFRSHAAGTTGSRQRVTPRVSLEFKVPTPPPEILERFNNVASDYFKSISINLLENEQLRRTRDYLIPRLLSGEIEVKATEEQVEEVLAGG